MHALSGRLRSRLAIALLSTLTLSAGILAPVVAGVDRAVAVASQPSSYVSVPAARIYDTKTGGRTALAAGETRTVTVLGSGGVPATGVSAIAIDVAATSSTVSDGSTLEVWTTGTTRPGDAIVRFGKDTVPASNTVIVAPDAQGRISVYNSAGSTDVNIDVQGYFSAGNNGGFHALRQTVVDTNAGLGITSPLSNGASKNVDATIAGVPVGATAVFANVIATSPSADGTLAFAASDSTTSAARGMNYSAGGDDTEGLFIPLSSSGRFNIKNEINSGQVGLKVEIQGYLTPTSSTTEGVYTPIGSSGVLDWTQLSAGATKSFQVGGTNGLPTYGVEGAVLTVLARSYSADGGIKTFAKGTEDSSIHTVRLAKDEAGDGGAAATAIIGTGLDGGITVKNTSAATVEVKVVLQGWFSGYRAVPSASEDQFVADAVTNGTPENLARLAVWNEPLLKVIPTGFDSEDYDDSALPEPDLDETAVDSAEAADSGPFLRASASQRDAANRNCAGDYKLGHYNRAVWAHNMLGEMIFKVRWRSRWCYNATSHIVGPTAYFQLSKPEFGPFQGVAWSFEDVSDHNMRRMKYDGYDHGSIRMYKQHHLQYCVLLKIGPTCTDKYYDYWVRGNYDGSKTAGGDWLNF